MPGLRRISVRPVRAALVGALLLPVAFNGKAARADVYHAVAPGETLAAVAGHFHVSVNALRAANKLAGTADNQPLGAMLLCVPGVADNGAVSLSVANLPPATSPRTDAVASSQGFGDSAFSPSSETGSDGDHTGRGTIARAVPETVRLGDTWESIARRYCEAGHQVTVGALKARNNYDALPVAGSTVLVPLGQLTYSYEPAVAPVVEAPSVSAPVPAADNNTLGGGVVASGELDLPLARGVASTVPVYRAPNAAPSRGDLPSRGGYGEMARAAMGGAPRVLGQGEEAAAPPAPLTRTATTSPHVAHVAQVGWGDARIRRLPQASAVTLYRCAVGTQLAVLQQTSQWSAVLMSDRSTGWVPTKYLRMTAQTVDVSHVVLNTAGPGGEVTGYGRNYATQNAMVAQALTWLGTPYHYGGTSRRGIDCSSLVQHAFAACGFRLPRTAAQQATVGTPVDPAGLRAGDRLYFSASGTRIDHTGLYMGDGLFVQASGSGHQVMVSNLFEPRNWNIFVGARR